MLLFIVVSVFTFDITDKYYLYGFEANMLPIFFAVSMMKIFVR
ncbi:hypothetical protein [Pedobacter changchengzhani]|nr:hypothetical protein [Pedobacter changchengzhani]